MALLERRYVSIGGFPRRHERRAAFVDASPGGGPMTDAAVNILLST